MLGLRRTIFTATTLLLALYIEQTVCEGGSKRFRLTATQRCVWQTKTILKQLMKNKTSDPKATDTLIEVCKQTDINQKWVQTTFPTLQDPLCAEMMMSVVDQYQLTICRHLMDEYLKKKQALNQKFNLFLN